MIETTKDLRSDLRWCSCNIFSTQYHAVAYIKFGESATVFSYKGESIEEYWECIMNDLIWPEDDFKGHRPDLIVYDGVDMTLPIHEGKKAGDFFLNYGTIPDSSYTDNVEFKIVQTIIKLQLEVVDKDKWKTFPICL